MRAALYARFSNDKQKARSIDDQLAEARRYAERQGWTVVAVFSDAARRGTTRVGRDGLEGLVAAIQATPRPFDVVVSEALDRVTRSAGDAWDIFDDMELAGVAWHTLSRGLMDEVTVSVDSMVAAMEVKSNGRRVRRGMAGVVNEGRWPNRPPFGYRRKVVHDTKGDRVKGLIEIDPDLAPLIRRIGAEYLAGASARAIALRLNAQGVPRPGGGLWEMAHILGNRPGGQGVLRNPVYGGELVWSRITRLKVRKTGGSRVRANAPADQVRHPAPELAIFDAATWAAIQAEVERRRGLVAAKGNPSAALMPKRLFSGLIVCGSCAAAMHVVAAGHYRCTARARFGAASGCDNNKSPRADQVEAQALDALRRDLLHPDMIEAFVAEYRRARAERQATSGQRRADLARQLADAEARAGRLVDQLERDAALANSPTIAARLAQLEAQAATARAALKALDDEARDAGDVVALHPRAPDRYRQMIEQLRETLDTAEHHDATPAERDAARMALRAMLKAPIRVFSEPGRAKWRLEVDPDPAALLGLKPEPAATPTHLRQRA